MPRSYRPCTVAIVALSLFETGCGVIRELASDIQGGVRSVDSASRNVQILASEMKSEYEQNAQRILTLTDDVSRVARVGQMLVERVEESTDDIAQLIRGDKDGNVPGILPKIQELAGNFTIFLERLQQTTDCVVETSQTTDATLASWNFNAVEPAVDGRLPEWSKTIADSVGAAAKGSVVQPLENVVSQASTRFGESLTNTASRLEDIVGGNLRPITGKLGELFFLLAGLGLINLIVILSLLWRTATLLSRVVVRTNPDPQRRAA